LKEEALDRTMWRNHFGRGFGPVVWQITDDDDDVVGETWGKETTGEYKYNMSVNNTTLYLYTIKMVYCQGDMFRPLLGHLQALWENRSKSYLHFNALWDPKCLQIWDPTMHWNIDSSWICFLREPEEDLIKVETCRPDNMLFLLYINKVLCYRLTCCI